MRSAVLLGLLALASAWRSQRRQHELTGARLLGGTAGGAAGYKMASMLTENFFHEGMTTRLMQRQVLTPTQQAAAAAAAALSGLLLRLSGLQPDTSPTQRCKGSCMRSAHVSTALLPL